MNAFQTPGPHSPLLASPHPSSLGRGCSGLGLLVFLARPLVVQCSRVKIAGVEGTALTNFAAFCPPPHPGPGASWSWSHSVRCFSLAPSHLLRPQWPGRNVLVWFSSEPWNSWRPVFHFMDKETETQIREGRCQEVLGQTCPPPHPRPSLPVRTPLWRSWIRPAPIALASMSCFLHPRLEANLPACFTFTYHLPRTCRMLGTVHCQVDSTPQGLPVAVTASHASLPQLQAHIGAPPSVGVPS